MYIRYVHVFMLFSLISMNKELNQNRFSKYPKAGPVPGGTGCAVTGWNRHAIRLALLEVAELYRYRKRFAVQSHERSRREVDEVVIPTNGHAGK
jgi:hypothetical protein